MTRLHQFRIALCAALLAALLGTASAAPAQEAESDAARGFVDGDASPLRLPQVLQGTPLDPRSGFQFGLGIHRFSVEAEAPALLLEPEAPFSDGTSLALEWVIGGFRLGYTRQIFRREVPEGTALADCKFEICDVNLLGFDADQFWVFHGFRPWLPLYFGYGVGWQRREIFFRHPSEKTKLKENLAMAGLMIDYAFALPFALQFRGLQEESGKILDAGGTTVFISYFVPF